MRRKDSERKREGRVEKEGQTTKKKIRRGNCRERRDKRVRRWERRWLGEKSEDGGKEERIYLREKKLNGLERRKKQLREKTENGL